MIAVEDENPLVTAAVSFCRSNRVRRPKLLILDGKHHSSARRGADIIRTRAHHHDNPRDPCGPNGVYDTTDNRPARHRVQHFRTGRSHPAACACSHNDGRPGTGQQIIDGHDPLVATSAAAGRNDGITSCANMRSCSFQSSAEEPSGQCSMTSSSPG